MTKLVRKTLIKLKNKIFEAKIGIKETTIKPLITLRRSSGVEPNKKRKIL